MCGLALVELFAVVTTILGDFVFPKKAVTAAFGVDFFGLKNEPSGWRLGRFAQHFVEVVQDGRFVERGFAFGLHLVKGSCGGGQDSVEALLVHREIYEGLGVLEENGGLGESAVDLGMP